MFDYGVVGWNDSDPDGSNRVEPEPDGTTMVILLMAPISTIMAATMMMNQRLSLS